MESKPLISVIIPVYNVGEFLTPCLDSLLAQTYQNLEILLIDDGSSDGSDKRCDEYAAKDSRFRVIHKENGGVSSARNLGLELAQGAYIAFVDADDLVKSDYFEVLCSDIIEQCVDIVFCNSITIDPDGNDLSDHYLIPEKRNVANMETALHEFVTGKGRHYSAVWGSLIRSDLAKQVRFPPYRFGEDTLYMFRVLFLRPKIYLNDYKGYFYLIRSSSATNTVSCRDLERVNSYIGVYSNIYESLPELTLEDQTYFLNRYAQQVYSMAHISSGLKDSTQRRHYYHILEEHLQKILPLKSRLPKKLSILLTLYARRPKLYSILARLKESFRKTSGR